MNDCILVFGMPRSGTTWVGKLFDSHPDTLYRHEPDSVQPLELPLYPEVQAAMTHRVELERFVSAIPRMRNTKVVGKQPLFAKRYQSSAALYAYRASVTLAKVASRVQRNFPCMYRPTGAGRGRLVWKSIESPGRLGLCVRALPEARGIHLMRHPCGYVASILRGEAAGRFGDPHPSAEEMWVLKALLATASGKRSPINLDQLQALGPEERLAWRWVLTQEKIIADVADCARVLSVRYEDVCADPLAMTWRMFQFCGLDRNPQTEAFVRASTHPSDAAAQAGYYSVIRQPQAAAERWRTELEPAVIERIMRVVRRSAVHRYYDDQVRAGSAEVPG